MVAGGGGGATEGEAAVRLVPGFWHCSVKHCKYGPEERILQELGPWSGGYYQATRPEDEGQHKLLMTSCTILTSSYETRG